MSNGSQKLGLTHIIDDSKKYDQLKRVTLADGRFTEIYAYFSNAKIDTMLEKYAAFIEDYQKNMGKIKDTLIIDYLNIFILLHFSTLTVKFDYTFNETLSIIKSMLDSQICEEIFEAFDKSEISRVFERFYKKIELFSALSRENHEYKEKLRNHIEQSDLESKEILLEIMK